MARWQKKFAMTFLALGLSSVQANPGSQDPALPHAIDAGWKGQASCELLYENDAMRVARCIFPPGIGHEKPFHNPHFGYVLEGGTLRNPCHNQTPRSSPWRKPEN